MNETSDDQLWRRSQLGDREAFGVIVERYQTLICSLAYCACGNLSFAEDLAQETFVAAWQQLGELREPAKLRAWLCGIVRKIAANNTRREIRRGHAPATLESVAELAGTSDDPALNAITSEEQSLLWRSIAELPETYRESLVLFYRQGQSVEEVAQSLDLSQDAVKQRLSRGRAILRDELAAVVESTLSRSRPTKVFTAAVLAALPAVIPSSASAAVLKSVASAGAASASKSLLASVSSWVIVGPMVGLLIGWFSSRAAASTARSPKERACLLRHARNMVIFAWTMSIGLMVALLPIGKYYTPSPVWLIVGVLGWTVLLVGTIMWTSSRVSVQVARIRVATGTMDSMYIETLASKGLKLDGPWLYQTKARALGLPLVSVACGGSDAGSFRSRVAIGWIAIGDMAVSPLVAMGGLAVGPFALGGITIGLLSFSLWGIAIGGLAFGSIALGWWAFGFGAIGWRSAVGAAAVAKDYALGALTSAAEANTPLAKEWIFSQWFVAPVAWFLYSAHWIILAIILVSLGRIIYRKRQLSL